MKLHILFVNMVGYIVLACLIGAASAFPAEPVLYKLDTDRYQYVRGPDDTPHLVDLWVTPSDLHEAARYDPDSQNVYHLFTRRNPSVSQPVMMGSESQLSLTNYNPDHKTVILMHGWLDSVSGDFTSVVVPAFLAVEDVNVFAVDWAAGASTINYVAAVYNTVTSGRGVARFLNWLSSVTGTTPASYIIAGQSLGGQQSGIVGRHLWAKPGYIISLDPASPGWITNSNRFHPDDGAYTEVIHTNAGVLGFLTPIGHVDFYPNGGINMPGCNNDVCHHMRAPHYFAESLISGGFTGTRCSTYLEALRGNCALNGPLQMGGLTPKTGETGIFYMETNAAPPFSRG